MADSVPVPDVASRGAGNAEDLSESEQLVDSPTTKPEIAKAVGSSSSSLLPDSLPPATLFFFPCYAAYQAATANEGAAQFGGHKHSYSCGTV